MFQFSTASFPLQNRRANPRGNRPVVSHTRFNDRVGKIYEVLPAAARGKFSDKTQLLSLILCFILRFGTFEVFYGRQ